MNCSGTLVLHPQNVVENGSNGTNQSVQINIDGNAALDAVLLSLIDPTMLSTSDKVSIKSLLQNSVAAHLKWGNRSGEQTLKEQLDEFMSKNPQWDGTVVGLSKKDSTKIFLGSPEFSYSVNPENTEKIVTDLSAKVIAESSKSNEYVTSDGDTVESFLYLKDSLGATKFAANYGLHGNWMKAFNPVFDENEWVKREMERLTREDEFLLASGKITNEQVRTEDEKKAIVYAQKDETWPRLTTTGSQVHDIIDKTFKGESIDFSRYDMLNSDHIKAIIKQVGNLRETLKAKYGEKCKILTEVGIISKEISEQFTKMLETNNKPKLDSINGRIDLLVIDEYGKAHIFDFKVCRKNVGIWDVTSNAKAKSEDEWDSTKKRAAAYQLALYSQILKQYGIRVDDCNIIPVKLDFSYDNRGLNDHGTGKYRINKLNKVYMNFEPPFGGYKNGFRLTETTTPDGVVIPPNVYRLTQTQQGAIFRDVAELLPSAFDVKGLDLKVPYDTFSTLFPGSEVGTALNVTRRSYKTTDWYLTSKEGRNYWSKELVNGKTIYRFHTGKMRVDCNSMDELRETIDKYVRQEEIIRSSEIYDLANTFREAAASKNIELLKTGFTNRGKVVLSNTMDKYVRQQWELISDDALISAGIFLFKKGDRVEIQVFTKDMLTKAWKGTMGSTILGEKRTDAQCTNIMEGIVSHLEGIKAMLVFANNPNILQGGKIRNISIINPWLGQCADQITNDQWIKNYNALRTTYPNSKLPALNAADFIRTDRALLELAEDRLIDLNDSGVKLVDSDNIMYDASKHAIAIEWVVKAMEKIRATYPGKGLYDPDKYQPGDNVWEAYAYLSALHNHLMGNDYTIEHDKGDYRNGWNPVGNLTSAPAFSASANIRSFGKMMDKYDATLKKRFNEAIYPMQTAIIEINKITGKYGRDAYRDFFRKQENGKLDPRFMFVRPENYNGPEKMKKLLSSILENLWKVKHPYGTLEQMKIDMNDESFYEVPLIKAAFSQRTFKRENGVFKSLEEWKDNFLNLVEDISAEDATTRADFMKEGNFRVFNPIDIDQNTRQNKLATMGVDYYEQNLETIIARTIYEYIRSSTSAEYGIAFSGIRLAMRRSQEHGGLNMSQVEDALTKHIKSKVYGDPIMKDELKPIHQAIAVGMHAFSTLRLAGAAKAFLREMVSGVYQATTRSAAGILPGLTAENYAKSIEYLTSDIINDATGISKTQQLCKHYSMANYSQGNLVNASQTNWTHTAKFSKNTLFLGSSSPDFFHRTAILIAKMQGDGCWDAYKLDETGELVYDMYKDARFKEFFANNVNHKDYLKQKALYYKYVEEWAQTEELKMDGKFFKLPEAYPISEQRSIKNYGDLLYGHYDKDSAALINDMFLGSFYMQFKTYATAKLEQWFLKPGTYNIGHYGEVVDEVTGERLFERAVFGGENNESLPNIERITESEYKALSPEQQKEWTLAMEWKGEPMEGIFYAMATFGKHLFTMDWNQLQKDWENPTKRALLMLGLSDLLIVGLLEFVLAFLFIGDHDMGDKPITPANVRSILNKEGGYLESLAYNVLYGAADDQLIFNTVLNMRNVSVTSLSKQYYNNTLRLLTGKESAFQYMTQSVGAISELKGIATKLANTE